MGSSDTEDFIREVTELHNISCSLLTKVNSEDETSNPFSLSSSRHSLLIVESDPEEGGSCSPEISCSPVHVVEKEPRNSYSLSSCSISTAPPIFYELALEAKPGVQKVAKNVVSMNATDEEPGDNNILRSLPILKRQGKFLESIEDTELSPLTPTDLLTPTNHKYEGVSLFSALIPCVDIRTDRNSAPG